MSNATVYKIMFLNQNSIYEIYAKHIDTDIFYGFVEVSELVFGDVTNLVVDPAEEKLKTEFAGVKRTYIPMHNVFRIDEMEQEGIAKIKEQKGKLGNVAQFPTTNYNPTDFNKT